ncbi:MAG: hypothetical protein H6710_13450 [Myxococcales bacterium]|nr:hypothetical protein [Myxococcales bacterium]MCB9705415.1 hypothetical protein [Myxococcales bacterium]
MIESSLPGNFRAIPELDELWQDPHPGRRNEDAVARGRAFHRAFKAEGPVRGIRTIDLLHFPYPQAFGLWQAPVNRARYVVMRNRLVVIEFDDFAGERRTLLVNPTEHDLSGRAPFFAQARRELASWVPDSVDRAIPGPAARLRAIGVDPAKIDYVTFDHLHVQDLRRGLGDLDGAPLYPRARLLVNRRELESLACLHPLQRPWWIEGALDGVDPARIVALEGSAWLGPGVALVWTPGHTRGNHSIVFNAPGRGVFAVSENGICPDAYLPRASHLASLRYHAATYGAEVILNGNALEDTFAQYTSMLLEREIADRGDAGGEVPNIYCSSPWVRSPLAYGIGPTFVVRPIHGGVLGAAAL